MSALDKLIERVERDGRDCGYVGILQSVHFTELAAEIAALRKRCEDAEAILRAQYAGRFRAWGTHDGGWAWSHGGPVPDGYMDDDGTDLPVLTDEARKALRGGA